MQLYEVEIKSKALLLEGKRGLITYFRGGRKKTIVKHVQKLYPQYTDPKYQPIVNITPISEKKYKKRIEGIIEQTQMLVSTSANVMKPEDYTDETMGD